MLDRERDINGFANELEFQILTARLGLRLSDHHTKKIFAKVRGNKPKNTTQYKLDENLRRMMKDKLNERSVQEAADVADAGFNIVVSKQI